MFVFATLASLATVSGATWTVDPGEPIGGNNFHSIQAAINAASGGDSITVYFGTYSETIVVDKSITLIGVDNPIIDAEWSGDVVTVTAPGCTVEALTIINGGVSYSGINIQRIRINLVFSSEPVYRLEIRAETDISHS